MMKKWIFVIVFFCLLVSIKEAAEIQAKPLGQLVGRRVVLDPGHGWSDSRGAAANGMRERDIVLDVAFRVKAILEREGIQVGMTRTRDEPHVRLEAADDRANAFNPEIVVSIHTNAGGGTGTEACYVVDKPTTAASYQLAQRLADKISRRLGLRLRGVFPENQPGRRCGNASYLYIHWMYAPAALIELAFIDGPQDNDVYKLRYRRQDFAEAIAEAIIEHLQSTPPGPPSPPGYTFCAWEGQRCSFSGRGDVAYGALDSYFVRPGVSGGIDCNNRVFGDPIFGVYKACFVRDERPPSSQQCDGRFKAQYFSNPNLSGSPVYTRCESRIDHDWGENSPGHGVPRDHFSARWEGRFHFDGGRYRFIARTDDGMRVWVDGHLVIDAWWDQPPTTHQGEISLNQGDHTVRVEWYENGGGAVAQVRWERIHAQDPHCGDRTEPNNPSNQGYWLQPGQQVEGYICPQNDIDWFRFTVNPGDEVRIRLQSLPADYDMVLYVNDQEVARSERGGTSDEEIVWQARAVGNGTRAYIKVYGWNGAWSQNDSYVISLEKHQSGGGDSCPNQYKAEYFNNRDLRGSPALVRCEGWPIRHDWGGGSPGPGVSSDNFSARWTGRAHIADGVYTFIARADDGIRVWLNGQILINQWKDQPPTEYRAVRRIRSGTYHIRVEYYEHGGGAVAQFRWEQGVHGGPGGYAFCANEGERCSFSGTKDVAYGANGSYTVKQGVRGGIDCNNNVFGDPAPGVFKACYIKDHQGGGGGGGNTGGPTYEIVAKHSGKCLDVEGARPDDGTNVQQWACGGGPNQRWRLVSVGDGYYKIVAVHSGKCLDVAGASYDDGANVIQWRCHGGDNQLWRIERVGDAYRIIAKHSGKALDVEGASPRNGANVQVWRYGGGPNQLWYIRRR